MEHPAVGEARERMGKTLDAFRHELGKIHTGRANPALLEDIRVEYYGVPTPLRQLANIVAPEPDLLVVRPFDRSQIGAIEKAIRAADLGLNPQNDGQLIRIKVPRLSEERRNELAKLVAKKAEEAKIALRNIRRELKERVENEKKEGKISEDEFFRVQKELDQIISEFQKKVDDLAAKKAEEMRTL